MPSSSEDKRESLDLGAELVSVHGGTAPALSECSLFGSVGNRTLKTCLSLSYLGLSFRACSNSIK